MNRTYQHREKEFWRVTDQRWDKIKWKNYEMEFFKHKKNK